MTDYTQIMGERIARETILPEDSAERKDIPMAAGLLDYFPAALAEVAAVSKAGNDKHNPGEPLHHARGKSMDHADCIVRHLVDRGGVDDAGLRHSAMVAWRALALLQQELEDAGAPLARGAVLPEPNCGVPGCVPPSPDCCEDENLYADMIKGWEGSE